MQCSRSGRSAVAESVSIEGGTAIQFVCASFHRHQWILSALKLCRIATIGGLSATFEEDTPSLKRRDPLFCKKRMKKRIIGSGVSWSGTNVCVCRGNDNGEEDNSPPCRWQILWRCCAGEPAVFFIWQAVPIAELLAKLGPQERICAQEFQGITTTKTSLRSLSVVAKPSADD